MNKVIIFGGTGFIGMSLSDHLADRGFKPILVGRNIPKEKLRHDFVKWDAHTLGDWSQSVEGAYAVINLAGKSVNCRKTPDHCDVILRSRVDATRIIGKCLKSIKHPPKIWIQMSTAHIYGDPPSMRCTEESATGYGLAPTVGKAWEEAFREAIPQETRGVVLRTSFVIGKDGGALKSLKQIVRFGLGGQVASGKQGMSWIHEYDMNEIIHQALINDKYQGVYNVTAPNPESQKDFMKHLRKAMNMPFGLYAPAFLIRFGSRYIMNTDPELILYGRYILPQKLIDLGYKFKYPRLDFALNDFV